MKRKWGYRWARLLSFEKRLKGCCPCDGEGAELIYGGKQWISYGSTALWTVVYSGWHVRPRVPDGFQSPDGG
jgi:hypothetical protein